MPATGASRWLPKDAVADGNPADERIKVIAAIPASIGPENDQ
jgi:hypothetical protein